MQSELLLTSIFCLFLKSIAEPIVEIEDGILLGTYGDSASGKLHSKFLSIPYAKPPIGSLRFKHPEPNDPWDGIKDATEHGNYCSQLYTSGFVGDEDCLFLSVHTPLTDFNFNSSSKGLPVMVFIHGGAYIFGWNSMADGFFLTDHDVIVVGVNYRLGPFGFLSLNTSEVSGNQGLRDQQLALKWVQKNIHKFGGDPTQVTIFGQSAGSWSIIHHLFAPGSKGLFSRAISHSGSILGLTLRSKESDVVFEQGRLFAEALLCYGSNQLKCLQSKSSSAILSVPYFARSNIDGSLTDDPVLPSQPESLIESGDFNHVPLIIGTTSAEGILAVDIALNTIGIPPFLVDALWNIAGPLLVTEAWPWEATSNDIELARKVKAFYFDGTITSEKTKELIDMCTDALFWYPTYRTSELLSAKGIPVYQYLFSHSGPYYLTLSSKSKDYHYEYGPSHADDLDYIFDFVGDKCELFEPVDFEIAELMTTFWSNFAKTGNPNGNNIMVNWEQYKESSFSYLNFSANTSMVHMDTNYKDRMTFWDSLVIPGK